MPTPSEVDRIAAIMHTLRPDWRTSSLVTFLTTHHGERPYRDLLIAAVVVATDPRTTTPRLLNEHGAWWVAAQVAFSGSQGPTSVPRHTDPRCEVPGHEHELAHNCRACASERLADPDPPVVTLGITPEQAAINAAGAALALAAMTDPTPTRPELDAQQRAAGERQEDA
ncbi:MAG: hypothetical protein ACO1ON_12975 [Nocardioides sp.]